MDKNKIEVPVTRVTKTTTYTEVAGKKIDVKCVIKEKKDFVEFTEKELLDIFAPDSIPDTSFFK